MTDSEIQVVHCDIAVIGGSTGGCAAAVAIPDSAAKALEVLMTEVCPWIGGQMTAQGVSALDEHAYIETFGAAAAYLDLRDAIREHYQRVYGAPSVMIDSVLGPDLPLNPGNGWVSRLCFLPADAATILEKLIESRGTRLFSGCKAISAVTHDHKIDSVTVENAAGQRMRIHARCFLDATDLGDLLPLTNTAYHSGAEARSDTGEPHAADDARLHETQGFTFCFAVEWRPGEDHTIPRPEGYADFRDRQPYTLSPLGRDGQPVTYRMFERSEQGNLPFWTYRRLYDGALLGGGDISLINWISNDYHGSDLIDASEAERERILDEARRLSLGFLHWLQTECPRDTRVGGDHAGGDANVGYPELKLRPDIMGTDDGLSQSPYIRESRRIVPLQRILEQDITAEFNPGARARHHRNSVGIGWYPMDLHPCVGRPDVSMYAPTKPFQIPLGSLIPQHTVNLIPACKNIGTTHLTNGAYRLHPVEWAVGAAAGALAAFCIENELTPHTVFADEWQTWRLQARLVRRGCPIFWAVDVPITHEFFFVNQLLLVRDLIVIDSERWHRLDIGIHARLGDSIDRSRLAAIADEVQRQLGETVIDIAQIQADTPWESVCRAFSPALERVL